MKTYKLSILCLFAAMFFSCSDEEKEEPVILPTADCSEVCEYKKDSEETAGTLKSSLDGTYELTMKNPDPDCPFEDGTKGTFTIKDNVLTVNIEGHGCITLKNPVLTYPDFSTEVGFRDTCKDKISYDVSEVDGKFNEINIVNLEGKWLGQFNNR